MGAYISYIRRLPTEETIEQYSIGGSVQSYVQKRFGLRVERMLPILSNSVYLGAELYRSWLAYDTSYTYNKDQRECIWIENGVSNFEAGNLLIGKKWQLWRRLLILTEAGYKSVKDISPKNSSRVTHNPCGQEQERPSPDFHVFYERYEQANSSWIFQTQVGFAF